MKQQVGPCSTLKGQSNLYTLKCFNLKVNQVTQIFANLCFMVQGIQTTVVYWPVKLRESGKVLFFRLQLWDCGENALRRFDHLFPVCIKYKVFSCRNRKKDYSHLIGDHRHTRCFVKSLFCVSFSPVRSRWTPFFSYSPSLTGHPLMICQIRLLSGLGRLRVVL